MSNRSRPPSYLKGKSRPGGGWYARTKVDGKEVSLGVWGSPESHQAYQRVVAEWRVSRLPGGSPMANPHGVTIIDLAGAFMTYAEDRYRRPDGSLTSEIEGFRNSLAPLVRTYGDTRARDFGPLNLKAVRQAMLDGSWLTIEEREQRKIRGRPTLCSKRTANQRVGRIVRVFAWGVSEQLVPNDVWQALTTVTPLRAGMPDVEPVSWQDVHDTLPCLGPIPQALVCLQIATGMRPGEVCRLWRPGIDRRGLLVDGIRVWSYRPRGHKTEGYGIKRTIALAPAAQWILTPFLAGPGEWVFPSRNGPYRVDVYIHQIRKAARRAGIPRWAPNQLRKTAATEIEAREDLATAQATLGHTSPETTRRHYSRAAFAKAAQAAARTG